MPAKLIAKEQWLGYFDDLSRSAAEQDIAIEIGGAFPLMRVQGTRLPLIGFTYDAAKNALEIVTDPIHHVISPPKSITANYSMTGLTTLDIDSADHSYHTIRFIEPLEL